ncbi:hypothetical protein M885DRAFT_565461 [Pelagophyceae sp. CCMP2097]|nr:hypothetical protein M885DRAFT_565461 [Pelagophyceae sp. CCMP2097]
MLREVLNAVFATFFATEVLIAHENGRSFQTAHAARRLCLWAFANFMIALWPTRLPRAPPEPLVVSFIEAVLVVAVASAGLKRCGLKPERHFALAAVFGVWLSLYVLNVPQLPAAAAEKFAFAAVAFLSTLFFDVRRSGAVPAPAFFDAVSAAVLYVAPVYPLLCIACSLVFLPIISIFEHFRRPSSLCTTPTV